MITINTITDLLEKTMLELPNNKVLNKTYLGGFIDGLCEAGVLNEDQRAELYDIYGPK